MRVILRGITGDPSLNGRVGHVGGIEGDRVFVRLDGQNGQDDGGRILKVKVTSLIKAGGNEPWTVSAAAAAAAASAPTTPGVAIVGATSRMCVSGVLLSLTVDGVASTPSPSHRSAHRLRNAGGRRRSFRLVRCRRGIRAWPRRGRPRSSRSCARGSRQHWRVK